MQNLFLNNFVVYTILLLINLHVICHYNLGLLHFFVQILEFDLKGIALDNSSSLTIIVKDFETIGQNKYVLFFFSPSIKHMVFDVTPACRAKKPLGFLSLTG